MTADSASSPLIRVKQIIPPPRAGDVPRARLETRLLGASTKLTAVVAPAGWGKTSLLRRWASGADPAARIAWITLDESDDEPVRFWSYVLTALRGAGDQLSGAALDALRASPDGLMTRVLPTLVNELAAGSTPHVLVLDDYQVITDREIHESVEFLLGYLPPTVRLVIASRWDPPLPLARMRVRRELTEIRADDLRFSPDEAATMLAAVAETELDPAAADEAWQRTEGWAAGLQLAGLALRHRPPPGAEGGPVHGDDRHLFDYFASEVLPALEPQQRDLLVRTAPLELLSGPLCDATLQRDGSAAVLRELERADLFVVAVDGDREWYRCHRLLRDALRHGPGAPDGPAAGEVLRRAAGWFEEHDRIDEAVRYRQQAGDSTAVAALLERYELWFMDRGWAAAYLAHADRLPEAVIGPRLALGLAYAAQVCSRLDRLGHWLDVCERRIDAETVVASWRDPRAAIVTMRAVASVETDPARAVALGERAVAMENAAGVADPPVALVALGGAYVYDGQFEAAEPILAQAWRHRDRGLWWPGVDLQLAGLLALSLLRTHRLTELDRLLGEAGPVADDAEENWGHTAAGVVVLLRLVDAHRRYQHGDLEQARTRLDHAMVLAEAVARPSFLATGLVFAADLELAEGRRTAARSSLTRAREIADTEALPPVVRSWLQDSETRIGRLDVRNATRAGDLVEHLTDRELQILRMLPGSATQREIGAALFLSINTVKAYNKSLYRKLGTASRQEAVVRARHLGLI